MNQAGFTSSQAQLVRIVAHEFHSTVSRLVKQLNGVSYLIIRLDVASTIAGGRANSSAPLVPSKCNDCVLWMFTENLQSSTGFYRPLQKRWLSSVLRINSWNLFHQLLNPRWMKTTLNSYQQYYHLPSPPGDVLQTIPPVDHPPSTSRIGNW